MSTKRTGTLKVWMAALHRQQQHFLIIDRHACSRLSQHHRRNPTSPLSNITAFDAFLVECVSDALFECADDDDDDGESESDESEEEKPAAEAKKEGDSDDDDDDDDDDESDSDDSEEEKPAAEAKKEEGTAITALDYSAAWRSLSVIRLFYMSVM
eukprot:5400019-Pleurochrysis_carterae.AAC.1